MSHRLQTRSGNKSRLQAAASLEENRDKTRRVVLQSCIHGTTLSIKVKHEIIKCCENVFPNFTVWQKWELLSNEYDTEKDNAVPPAMISASRVISCARTESSHKASPNCYNDSIIPAFERLLIYLLAYLYFGVLFPATNGMSRVRPMLKTL